MMRMQDVAIETESKEHWPDTSAIQVKSENENENENGSGSENKNLLLCIDDIRSELSSIKQEIGAVRNDINAFNPWSPRLLRLLMPHHWNWASVMQFTLKDAIRGLARLLNHFTSDENAPEDAHPFDSVL